MNSSQDPFAQSPIAAPDGQVAPMPSSPVVVDHSDWKSAPQIVRSARTWNIFVACMLSLGVLGLLMMLVEGGSGSRPNTPEDRIFNVLLLLFIAVLAVAHGWLAWAGRKGLPVAWTVQIILSALGVLNFPLGTIIHAYILSQWFNPQTKAWFGKV